MKGIVVDTAKKIAQAFPGRTHNRCQRSRALEDQAEKSSAAVESKSKKSQRKQKSRAAKKSTTTKNATAVVESKSQKTPRRGKPSATLRAARKLVTKTPTMELDNAVKGLMALRALSPAVPTPTFQHRHNAVRAEDIFSPSYNPRQSSTGAPAMPLLAVSSCLSGPFLTNTPMLKERYADSIIVGKRLFSNDEYSSTPLPYKKSAGREFALKSPMSMSYAV